MVCSVVGEHINFRQWWWQKWLHFQPLQVFASELQMQLLKHFEVKFFVNIVASCAYIYFINFFF